MSDAREQVGSLVWVGVRGGRPGEEILERDLDACARAGVGGVILFDVDVPAMERLIEGGVETREARARARRNIESPDQVRSLCAHVRARLGDGTMIGIDQEGGRVSRLHEGNGFVLGPSPRELATLAGEARRAALCFQARQVRHAGIDVNLGPCVDVAIETESSIIARQGRSFGDNIEDVVACAHEVIRAHTDAGVGACLKHFPGHGSARGDTHKGFVDITETWDRDRELEVYRRLLDDADDSVGVMVAHVVDRTRDGSPSSLSRACVEGLLRNDLGFDGVVMTDALDMRAITSVCPIEEACVRAIEAGCDVVMDGFNLEPDREDHPSTSIVDALRRAMREGRLSEERIDRSLARLGRYGGALRPSHTQYVS
ncbi:MAG: glycoside hydrolase family 3 N-terminal domain-containing protein [Phycisphaerales bacterium JB043]